MPDADPTPLVRCERAETAAFAAMQEAVPPALAAAAGLASARIAGALAIASRSLEKRACNHVFGLGLERAVTRDDVRAVETHCRAAGAKRCSVIAAPGPHGAALEAALAAEGFAIGGRTLRLAREVAARDSEPHAPSSLGVREAAPEDAAAFGALLAGTFAYPAEFAAWFAALVGRPGWRVFGAYDGARMVACGALHASGGDAWLGLGATAEGYRGRGAQSAIIAARLAAAREANLAWAAAETAPDTPEKPNPSTHNLRRLGFTLLYERPTWVKVLRED